MSSNIVTLVYLIICVLGIAQFIRRFPLLFEMIPKKHNQVYFFYKRRVIKEGQRKLWIKSPIRKSVYMVR
jgi:hypothetical protein